ARGAWERDGEGRREGRSRREENGRAPAPPRLAHGGKEASRLEAGRTEVDRHTLFLARAFVRTAFVRGVPRGVFDVGLAPPKIASEGPIARDGSQASSERGSRCEARSRYAKSRRCGHAPSRGVDHRARGDQRARNLGEPDRRSTRGRG